MKLAALRAAEPDVEVPDDAFTTLEGTARLSARFAGRDKLVVIHNMGWGCRDCTLWADGIHGVLSHLEAAMAVVLVSRDPPDDAASLAQFHDRRRPSTMDDGGDNVIDGAPRW